MGHFPRHPAEGARLWVPSHSFPPGLSLTPTNHAPYRPLACMSSPQGGHTLAGRQDSSTPGVTWAQHGEGYPHRSAEQRVQHEHPVWADLAPAEDLLHLEREKGRGGTQRWGSSPKGLESLESEASRVGGLGAEGGAGKLGRDRCPFLDSCIFTGKTCDLATSPCTFPGTGS